ncbi:PREDICTED: uncharacterized protein LOC108759347 [Trachymyrmex cornetzi]|uniref:uncharacterized protein LOC108759347 n=1 Tax=Trachymyrmex cornetzi TaxID=471704 RepID=UPI00084EDAEB|nr:PREDICTED: uncharacterized protein LOC108759347 [Trachymyrmex cornetzi]
MGFRPLRSSNDNLVIITNHIRAGFLRGEVMAAAFLDIQGAFDNVVPGLLVEDLKNIDIPAVIRQFVWHLTGEREIYFVVDREKTGPRLVHKGTPQGSTLSPILFDIYLKDVNDQLHEDTRILQYADDIVVYSSASVTDTFNSIQISLNKLVTLLRDRDMELSASKSKLIVFSEKRSLRPNTVPNVCINNQRLDLSASVRFLGVILDSKLSGKEHLNYLIQKTTSNIIATLAGIWWGSHPQSLLTIYRAIFRGAIEYGTQVYSFNNNATLFLKLDRLQYKIIRKAMGYRISTPINIILYKVKEQPLKQRFALLTAKFLYKSFAQKFSLVTSSIHDMEIAANTHSKRVAALGSSPSFKDAPHLQVLAEFTERTRELTDSSFAFYTDGSKLEENGPVGASIYSPDLGFRRSCKLPSELSVFSAEKWAILETVFFIRDGRLLSSVIFTDFRSVIEANSTVHNSSLNHIVHQLKYALYCAKTEGLNIVIFWIPAHRGIPGNKTADALAKQAARDTNSRRDIKVPFTDALKNAKDAAKGLL